MRIALVLVALTGIASAGTPRLEFTGNDNAPGIVLRAKMKVPFDSPTAPFDDDALGTDLLYISSYYWDHGYANVRVAYTYDRSHDTITVKVVEGAKFTMGSITIKAPEQDLPALKLLQNMRSGQLFSRTDIANERQAMAESYYDRGYAYANVLPMTKIDTDKRTIALSYEVDPGKICHVEKLDLYNSSSVADAVLLGEITSVPGSLFSNRDLEDAKARIIKLANTDKVVISMKRGSTDELVEVTFEVGD